MAADAATPSLAGVAATALWTAYCRAEEAKRPDALVVDRLAGRLCGEDGLRIGRALEERGRAHDAIVVRTAMIDERIVAASERGIRTILSLGCGLCARPQRLALPPDTRFVEVDLPDAIAWKERQLAGAPALAGPSIARLSADLSRVDQLAPTLERVVGVPLLVVLEGVVQYLEPPHVRALFSRLAARRAATTVVCDIGGGSWDRWFSQRIRRAAASTGAAYRTRIADPPSFFAPLGFEVTSSVSLVDWDARQSVPRWRTPWTARLVPGFRRAARIIELVGTAGPPGRRSSTERG